MGLAEAVLDLDQAPEEYLVRPEYDEELQELHKELQEVQDSVKNEHEATQDAWNDISSISARIIQLKTKILCTVEFDRLFFGGKKSA